MRINQSEKRAENTRAQKASEEKRAENTRAQKASEEANCANEKAAEEIAAKKCAEEKKKTAEETAAKKRCVEKELVSTARRDVGRPKSDQARTAGHPVRRQEEKRSAEEDKKKETRSSSAQKWQQDVPKTRSRSAQKWQQEAPNSKRSARQQNAPAGGGEPAEAQAEGRSPASSLSRTKQTWLHVAAAETAPKPREQVERPCVTGGEFAGGGVAGEGCFDPEGHPRSALPPMSLPEAARPAPAVGSAPESGDAAGGGAIRAASVSSGVANTLVGTEISPKQTNVENDVETEEADVPQKARGPRRPVSVDAEVGNAADIEPSANHDTEQVQSTADIAGAVRAIGDAEERQPTQEKTRRKESRCKKSSCRSSWECGQRCSYKARCERYRDSWRRNWKCGQRCSCNT